MKRKEKEIKPVSKSTMFIAWLLLIVLICGVGFITYLKFFNNNDAIEEYPVNNTEATSPVITGALQEIVDNFNNSTYVSDYKAQNIEIVASLTDTTIIIDYINGDVVSGYQFDFNAPNLVCSVIDDELENFASVYKIMVYANQVRLGNQTNIDSYVNTFLNGGEIIGLTKEQVDGVNNFSIDVSKVIGEVGTEVGTEDQTNNNVDTTTNNGDVITDDTDTKINDTNTNNDNTNVVQDQSTNTDDGVVGDDTNNINNNVEGVE